MPVDESFTHQYIALQNVEARIKTRFAAMARAEIEAERQAWRDRIIGMYESRTATVQEMAQACGLTRQQMHNHLKAALAAEGRTVADARAGVRTQRVLGAAEEARRSRDVFKRVEPFMGNLHVKVGNAAGDGIMNVYLEPRGMRVINISERENGAMPIPAGAPEPDDRILYWQEQLDTEGTTLRNTVDKYWADQR